MTYSFENYCKKGAAMLVALLLASPALAAPIGIVNGGFEVDATDDVNPPTGWTDSSASASFWTSVFGDNNSPSASDLMDAGFAGGYYLNTARLSAGVGSQPVDGQLMQTVDLSAFGAAIDNGDQQLFVDFDWASGDFHDTGVFSLHFFATTDGSGAELGGGFSEMLDDADGFNLVTAHESVGGLAPVGARSVTLQIDTTRDAGSQTDLVFDNFTGDISTIPEPASALLLGLGGLALASVRRRF